MSINNKKIVDLAQKEKRMVLYTLPGGYQYVGVARAIYPLLGVPVMSEDAIRAVYALPDTVKVEEKEALPEEFDFALAVKGEQPVFYEKIQLQPVCTPLISLRCSRGVVFIEAAALKPLEPGENGECILYERQDTYGRPYIVAKQGMLAEAVILPRSDVLRADWLDDLQNLSSALRQTFEQEKR